MANRYQYETSPRKLEPDYKTEKKRQNIRVVRCTKFSFHYYVKNS